MFYVWKCELLQKFPDSIRRSLLGRTLDNMGEQKKLIAELFEHGKNVLSSEKNSFFVTENRIIGKSNCEVIN